MIHYKNPNYWFLFLSALLMSSIAVVSYFMPNKIPFASEGIGVKLYRINYSIIALMVLLSNNISIIRCYLILTGWVMIIFVVSTWLNFPSESILHFTKQDNILHSNVGVISIFIGVIYGQSHQPKEETL
jgi:hypothetical protein